jgi:hypothetical protein
MGELIVFGVIVALAGGVGIWLGILVAPRLGRWAERQTEDEDDGDRPD